MEEEIKEEAKQVDAKALVSWDKYQVKVYKDTKELIKDTFKGVGKEHDYEINNLWDKDDNITPYLARGIAASTNRP